MWIVEEPDRKRSDQQTRAHVVAIYLWLLSLCVGLAVGVGIGAAIGRIGAGVAIGTTAGAAVGLFLARHVESDSKGDS